MIFLINSLPLAVFSWAFLFMTSAFVSNSSGLANIDGRYLIVFPFVPNSLSDSNRIRLKEKSHPLGGFVAHAGHFSNFFLEDLRKLAF